MTFPLFDCRNSHQIGSLVHSQSVAAVGMVRLGAPVTRIEVEKTASSVRIYRFAS